MRAVVFLGGTGLVLALLCVPPAYWRYVQMVPTVAEPLEVRPVPNGYERALLELKRLPPIPTGRDAPERRISPGLTAQLKGALPSLERIRKSFSLPWCGSPTPKNSLSAYSRFTLGARYFALESRVAQERGDTPRALSCAIDAMELGYCARQGGALNEVWTGQTCQFTGLLACERLYPQLTPVGLPAQIARVRRLRLAWPTITDALAREKDLELARCAASLREVARLSLWQQLQIVESGNYYGLGGDAGPGEVRAYAWDTWRHALTPHAAALADLDRYYRDLIDGSSRPAPHGIHVPAVSNCWSKYCMNPTSFGEYRGEWARNNLAVTEVALAVRQDAFQRGHYARSLAEIPKSGLPEVPSDVWGYPVAYELRNARPYVYSVGPDGKGHAENPVEPAAVLSGKRGALTFGKLCPEDWPKKKRGR